jgi:hypothetical protein
MIRKTERILNRVFIFFLICISSFRLCSSDISVPSNECNGSSAILAHNLYQNTTASTFSNPYRHLQHNALTGGLNLSTSSSSSSSSGNNPSHTSSNSSSSQSQAITTISNNPYTSNNNNNNHLYQHHQVPVALSGHNLKHSSSSSSGNSTTSSHHHPTPIEGLTALSTLGASTLHLNSLASGGTSSLTAADLGMSHWLTDGGSNSGKVSFFYSISM